VLEGPGEGSLRPLDVLVLVAVRLYRDGIADALRRDLRFNVVGSVGTLQAAQRTLEVLTRPPEVALVDLGVPGGIGATRVLRIDSPSTGIVALAVREADEDVVSWAEAGVAGLVSREATVAELLDAVEAAARAEVITSPAVTAALLRRVASVAGARRAPGAPVLTRREREILGLVGRGLSNKEIARVLGCSDQTVKNHLTSIMRKTDTGDRTQAVLLGFRRGWISVETGDLGQRN
jgi:DNA-binding NarL/FixJ family response regulator